MTRYNARCILRHTAPLSNGSLLGLFQAGAWDDLYPFAMGFSYCNPLFASILLELGADPTERIEINEGLSLTFIHRPMRFIVRDGNIAAVSRMTADRILWACLSLISGS